MRTGLSKPCPQALAVVVSHDHEEASLWRRWTQEDDVKCRDQLFEKYMPFAKNLAFREFNRRPKYGLELSDFNQLAYAGLLQAIDHYDPVAGCSFKTFSRYRIIGSIADGSLNSSERASVYSETQRNKRARLKSLMREENQPLDALKELVANLAITVLVETITREVTETVPDLSTPDAFETYKWNEMRSHLEESINNLPDNEEIVVKRHYLDGLNFIRIAELLRLTKGRISQIHKSAIGRLRNKLKQLR